MQLIRQGRVQESEASFRAALEKIEAAGAGLQVAFEGGEVRKVLELARGARRGRDAREDEPAAAASGDAAAPGAAEERGKGPAEAERPGTPAPAEAPPERATLRDAIERAVREKVDFGREYLGQMRQHAHYNIACALALRAGAAAVESPERGALATEAFAHLDRALAAGWADARHMQHDDDLAVLRGDPRFATVLEACRARARRANAAERQRERAEKSPGRDRARDGQDD
jgi:hypothetical protein